MHKTQGQILIVDDNKINRMLLARVITEQGHLVTSAEDGHKALEHLQAAPAEFDVVLLDILMPTMDGFQVLEIIKNDPGLRHIPVIMISAVEDMESVIQCIGMGATDYLHKPFNPALLKARLNASLANKRVRDLELEYLEQVGHVVEAAQAVESSQFDPKSLDPVAAREDALGQLARVFQRMAREIYLREQRLKQQLQRLTLDIEEMKKASTEHVSVYLPMDRRQAIANQHELPVNKYGATLFADISGFTPLTAALANELGLEQGAEELTRSLNQVYNALIAEVERFGGSVIGFSGDAITCWFADDDLGPDDTPGEAGHLALSSAFAMQQAMQNLEAISTPEGKQFTLYIKVAVGIGPVKRFLVGDPNIRRIETISGHVLDQIAAAEHLAQRGEVIVTQQTMERLKDLLTVSEWRRDETSPETFAVVADLKQIARERPWPEIPPQVLNKEICRPWILPAIYERSASGGSQFLAELRPACALFLMFGGIDYENDPAAGERLDAFTIWVQSVVEDYEGALIQLTIGDKGSYIYIAFGAPIAHENDAARAVSAAMILRSPPDQLNISSIRIGVAQGQMRAGTYGSSNRRTYGVLGDKTNLAARLMQAAPPGDILCDSAIYKQARGRFVFETLAAIHVKGKTEAIPIFRPIEERARLERTRTHLAGRDIERQQLLHALERRHDQTGNQIIIFGSAGMGKSRLLEELHTHLTEKSMAIFHETVPQASRSDKTALWSDLAKKWLSQIDQIEHLQSEPLLRQLNTENDLLQSLSLIQKLLGTEIITTEGSDILKLILHRLTQHIPIYVTLDDGEYLGTAGWQMIRTISQIPGVSCIVASSELPNEAHMNEDVHIIALQALSGVACEQIMCKILNIHTIPDSLIQLLQKADGNPFFVEEITYALVEEGWIEIRDGECIVNSPDILSKITLPTTIQGVIKGRIDRLSPEEQLVLKVASVIGHEFSVQSLQETLPEKIESHTLDRIIGVLQSLSLLMPVGDDGLIAFGNTTTHQIAYNSMLFAQRRQLHRRIAESLEKKHAADLSPYFAQIAEHWRQADEPTRAIDYLEKAGHYALKTGQLEAAQRLFKAGLELEAQSAVLTSQFYDEPGTRA